MAQQQVQKEKTVKRIDEAAREQEDREHEELLSKARRTSKKASRTITLAVALIEEIERII